ncbi:sigma-70 family RNA polymerase sigma factor [Blastopirellula sp. J2-11]|uniref:sigma-70 family RNA polymerase sigma factor n=1 Tax=Blastopirellula sp. J2-11 TaxID=2943192 RepID=UPI0021C8DB1F|nr:sigma-70 family RNA polymerase sigma factor [Blastopirellula sp. J2-11]UUO05067.1 sigma-70 family RNA polymerase sigma factor [Blastopirellula sp. J2-11]
MPSKSRKLAETVGDENQDDASRFLQLFMEHERQLRFYLHQLLPDRDDVDEVMQNTSIVLWTKFAELEEEAGFIKWAYVVARYEVLMYRRQKARDRLILNPDLLTTIALEISETPELVQDYQHALRGCLDKLVEQDRRLILQTYSHGLKVAQLAEELRRSVQSIYRKLSGLRQQLARCVRLSAEH